jgi:hypothetical protein
LEVGPEVVGLAVVGEGDGTEGTGPLDTGPVDGPDVVGRGVAEVGVVGLDGGPRTGLAVVDLIVGMGVVGLVRVGRAAAGLDDGVETGDGVGAGFVVGKTKIGVRFGARVPAGDVVAVGRGLLAGLTVGVENTGLDEGVGIETGTAVPCAPFIAFFPLALSFFAFFPFLVLFPTSAPLARTRPLSRRFNGPRLKILVRAIPSCSSFSIYCTCSPS